MVMSPAKGAISTTCLGVFRDWVHSPEYYQQDLKTQAAGYTAHGLHFLDSFGLVEKPSKSPCSLTCGWVYCEGVLSANQAIYNF